MQRTEFVDDARQDFAFALRTLGRQKAWTAITVATLALGIGATTAVFSVVSTLLLHPLPYPHADRVVYVEQQPTRGNNTGVSVSIIPSAPVIREWRATSHSFEAMEPQLTRRVDLKTTTGEPSSVHVDHDPGLVRRIRGRASDSRADVHGARRAERARRGARRRVLARATRRERSRARPGAHAWRLDVHDHRRHAGVADRRSSRSETDGRVAFVRPPGPPHLVRAESSGVSSRASRSRPLSESST